MIRPTLLTLAAGLTVIAASAIGAGSEVQPGRDQPGGRLRGARLAGGDRPGADPCRRRGSSGATS
jgi:hypothetical protein